jgi:hypothetical protein
MSDAEKNKAGKDNAGRLGDAYIFVGRIPNLLKESKTSSAL